MSLIRKARLFPKKNLLSGSLLAAPQDCLSQRQYILIYSESLSIFCRCVEPIGDSGRRKMCHNKATIRQHTDRILRAFLWSTALFVSLGGVAWHMDELIARYDWA